MTGLKRATGKQLLDSGTALHRICPCVSLLILRNEPILCRCQTLAGVSLRR